MGVPMGGNYYQSSPQINFDWLGQSWNLFKGQAGAWIGAILLYLLAAAVIGVPVAYATGYAHDLVTQINQVLSASRGGVPPPQPNPFANIGHSLLFSVIFASVNAILIGGLYRTALRQVRGEAVNVAGAFSAFDVALPLLLTGIVTQVCVTIGTYLCFLPALIVGGLFMFAPLVVVDRKFGPFQAISESITLLKSQWLMATLFFFVVSLIGGLGGLVCGVGVAVTYPLLLLSVALGYAAFTQPSQPLPGGIYGTPQPGVWPPPPTQGQAPPPPENLPSPPSEY